MGHPKARFCPGCLMLARCARSALYVLCFAAITLIVVGNAAVADDEPQPVSAQLQSIQNFNLGKANSVKQVQLGSFRFDGQYTVPALSLGENLSLDPSATWTAGNFATMGLHGLRSSIWIAKNGPSVGVPLKNSTDELTAEQFAIWSYTNGFKLNSSTVPVAAIRSRAVALAADAARAPAQVNLGAYGVGISAILTDVSPTTVTLSVQLSGTGDLTFKNSQSITAHIEGRVATIETSKTTYVDINRPGKDLVTKVTGTAPDNNTAVIQIPRNAATIEISFDWSIQFIPPLILLPNKYGSPPIVTTQPVPLYFEANIVLDPSQYPSFTGLLNNKALALIGSLSGLQGWIAVILVIWLAPLASRAITALVVGGYKAGAARYKKRRRPSEGIEQANREGASSGTAGQLENSQADAAEGGGASSEED